MKRKILIGVVAATGLLVSVGGAWAAPGLIQQSVRSGFWSNQFPDTAFTVQHFYYIQSDKAWDDGGDKVDTAKTKTTLNLSRFIRPWHFGDQKQYQFILEGIIPLANVSWEKEGTSPAGHVSGMLDPFLYLAQGWNNPDKTTHVQGAFVIQFPFGDNELTSDAYNLTPILAVQQHFGKFSVDASLSYQFSLKKLDGSDDKGRNYAELNVIPSMNLGGGWDVFGQYDYVNYQKSQTGGDDNDDAGYNHCLALGVNNWFRPNMQLGVKYEQDIKGKNTAQNQAVNVRYVWIF